MFTKRYQEMLRTNTLLLKDISLGGRQIQQLLDGLA
jgi:hypothetical protein